MGAANKETRRHGSIAGALPAMKHVLTIRTNSRTHSSSAEV